MVFPCTNEVYMVFPCTNEVFPTKTAWLYHKTLDYMQRLSLCQKLIVFKTNAAVSGSIALYYYKQLLTTKMASHGKLDALWVNR